MVVIAGTEQKQVKANECREAVEPPTVLEDVVRNLGFSQLHTSLKTN